MTARTGTTAGKAAQGQTADAAGAGSPSAEAVALLRWARQSEVNAVAVVRPGGFTLRYPLFDQLDQSTRGGLRGLSGPGAARRFDGLAEVTLTEALELLRSGRSGTGGRFARLDGEGAIELCIERLCRPEGDVAIAIAHATAARPVEPPEAREGQREEKLQAMGLVASGVAHDLNHSLNVIALRLERMRQDPALAEARPQLDSLGRVADEAAATVARLQDLVRRRRDAPAGTLELPKVVEAAVEAARTEMEEVYRRLPEGANAPAPQRIEVEVPPGLPRVTGSAAEVGHIFLDLLLNARDAMAQGGLIRVTARIEGEQVIAAVEDEGPGVPERYLHRIFDPFFTLSATRDTGMGLSIAAGVMERLGGSIAVANRPLCGAAYTLVFPVAHDERPRPRSSEPAHAAHALHILLVDDESDNVEMLGEVLHAEGHEVFTAESGRAALEQLRGHPEIDLVLCDVGMPGMSGWQFVREARQEWPALRIYMLTGWANEIAADDPRARLVLGVLGKPLDLRELRRLLAGLEDGGIAQQGPES